MGTIERTFSIHDTAVHIGSGTEVAARKVFIAVQSLLRRNGFTVRKDPKVERDFKILSKYRREANHGELKCKIEHSGICVSIEFYQSIVFTNPHGGEYDFNKLEKMPYLIRLRFQKSVTAIRSFLEKRGFTNTTRTLVTEDPLKSFNESWDCHHFKRNPDGWPCESVLRSWRRIDADGVVVNNGDTRYCIVGGRPFRCKVYGGINGMWECVYGPGRRDVTCSHVSGLYSFLPSCGRVFTTKERLRRMESVIQESVGARNFLRAHHVETAAARLREVSKQLLDAKSEAT